MKTLRPLGLLATVLAFPLVNAIQAAPITINNYSFETPVAPVDVNGAGAIYVNNSSAGFGWTTNSNATPPNTNGTINAQIVNKPLASGNPGNPAGRGVPTAFFEGNQAIRLFGSANQANVAYVQQVTAANLLGSTTYTLSLNIGPFGSGSTNNYTGFNITLSAGADFYYNVATNSVGGALPSSVAATTNASSNIASANYSFSNGSNGYNLAMGTYTTMTLIVVTNASVTNAGPLTIKISAGNRALDNQSTVFDNVALDAVTVPEPSVVGVLSLAGIAFGLYHVRRRARALR